MPHVLLRAEFRKKHPRRLRREQTPLIFSISLGRTATEDDTLLISTRTCAAACVSFHSDWMGRGPSKNLLEEASARRRTFPVVAVIVVHDEISVLRQTLEDVVDVVEHIVRIICR